MCTMSIAAMIMITQNTMSMSTHMRKNTGMRRPTITMIMSTVRIATTLLTKVRVPGITITLTMM